MKRTIFTAMALMVLMGSPAMAYPVRTANPDLRSTQPLEGKAGEKVTLNGSNFGAGKTDNVVMFEGSKAEVLKSSPTSIAVTVPKDAKPGENRVTVTVGHNQSKALIFKIKDAPPELSSLSLRSAPPGTQVTISGKHFSTKMSENKVSFGGSEAIPSSGSAESLTVTIPDMSYPQSISVSVTSDGQRSTNQLQMDLSNRQY